MKLQQSLSLLRRPYLQHKDEKERQRNHSNHAILPSLRQPQNTNNNFLNYEVQFVIGALTFVEFQLKLSLARHTKNVRCGSGLKEVGVD